MAYIEELISKDQADWTLSYGALVHYRAGNREPGQLAAAESIELEVAWSAPPGTADPSGGRRTECPKKSLQEAFDVAAEECGLVGRTQSYLRFSARVRSPGGTTGPLTLTLLHEAEQAIQGETTHFDGAPDAM